MRPMTLLLAAIVLTSASASSQLRVTGQAEPVSSLPGIPVEFVLTIENVGSTPMFYREYVQAEVQTQDAPPRIVINPGTGDPAQDGFLPRYATREQDGTDRREIVPYLIRPGEKHIHTLATDSHLSGPAFFNDPILGRPGHYRLRLAVDASPELRETVAQVWSNSFPFEVVEPQAQEAEVWNRLQEIVGRRFWTSGDWRTHRAQASEMIWRDFPRSQYAQYVALLLPVAEADEHRRVIDLAIGLDPKSHFVEYLRWGRARLVLTQAREQLNAKRMSVTRAEVQKAIESAEAEFRWLAKNGRTEQIRAEAASEFRGIERDLNRIARKPSR